MDGNFNNEQNDFVTEEYTENANAKQFDEVAPDHLFFKCQRNDVYKNSY